MFNLSHFMIENNIKRVLLKYKSLLPETIIERELIIYKTNFDKANVLVGPRRAGKSFFLYGTGKLQPNPVFINFEDNLLTGLNALDLNKILDCAKELFGKENLSFFLDEVQSIIGWEKFVISLLNEHYQVYVTGSNSRLLSREIASSLRGKSLPYLLLPFSFKEYLKVKQLMWDKNVELTDRQFEIKDNFSNYFKYGGFPEVVLSGSEQLQNKLVNNYFDSILYKDLIDRLGIKNIKLVEITLKYVLNCFGNTFSISAYENYLKANKIPYSLEDLYNILRSLQDVFMVCYVKEYSKSYKKMEFSKSKVYLFDTSYIYFLSNEPNDYGRILENLIFIELFRRKGDIDNKSIFYYNSEKGRECDFVILNKGKPAELVQVTYELNDKNREREINSLTEAMDKFNLNEGLIITYDQEEETTVNNKSIKITPAWKWVLNI